LSSGTNYRLLFAVDVTLNFSIVKKNYGNNVSGIGYFVLVAQTNRKGFL